jgi:hypothetical protein
MPTETITAPSKSFGQSLADTLKPFEADLPKAGTETKTTPEPAKTEPVKVEPAKVEPVKVEAKPAVDPDDEIVSGKRSPKGEDFKRVKTAAAEAAKQRDELKGRAETFEKELLELKKAPKHNAELIQKIERERDEYKTKYDQVALAYDPDFNASYKTKVDSVIESVKALVPQDRADDLAMVLQMPESARKHKALLELTEDLDQFSINDIAQAKRDVMTILKERGDRINKSQEGLASLIKEKTEKFEAYKTQRSKLFDDMLAKAQDSNPVFKTRDGDAPEVKAWNEAVADRAKTAKSIYMGEMEGDEVRAEAAMWAASAPGFLSELSAYQKENTELKATLAKLQGAAPGLQATGNTQQAKGPVSFAQAVSGSIRG